MTNIETFVGRRLRDLNWQYRFNEDSFSGAVAILFSPPEGLQLWQRFPSVIFMDCTHKSLIVTLVVLALQVRIPLLVVVGGTNTVKSSTFPIALGLLSSEREEAYW